MAKYQEFIEQANVGDKNAQFEIGNAYFTGDGVTQNYNEALAWYKKSAEQEFPPAQNKLGYMYSFGVGVSKNIEEAKKWYQKSVVQNDPEGKTYLNNINKFEHQKSFVEKMSSDYVRVQQQNNQTSESYDQMLFQSIEKMEQQHKSLFDKLEKNGFSSFIDAAFKDKMTYVKLKNELSLLHLTAATMARKFNCKTSYGYHLFRAYCYNPLLFPDFLKNESIPFLPEITSYRAGKQLTFNLLTISLTLASIPPALLAIYVTLVPFTVSLGVYYGLEVLINAPIQYTYTSLHCLDEISDNYSAKDCLFHAIASITEGDNFLAVRYLLEAANRSEIEMPEIEFLLSIAKENYKRKSVAITYDSIYNQNVKKIVDKVELNKNLQRKNKNINPYFVATSEEYKYSVFFNFLYGNNTHDSYGYSFSIAELVKLFKNKLYTTYPELSPVDYWGTKSYLVSEGQYSSKMPLRELLAYISQLTNIPDEYINISLASQHLADEHKEAEEYLQTLLNKNSGAELAAIEFSKENPPLNKEDFYTDNLALLVYDCSYIDCDYLQSQSEEDYWLALHNKIAQKLDISSMPLHLRNPIIYIKKYIDTVFPDDNNRRQIFFYQFVTKGCDINKKLGEVDVLSNNKLLQSHVHKLVQMFKSLSLLEIDLIKRFIREYHASGNKDSYYDKLVSYVRDKNHLECERLQNSSAAKYWLVLHTQVLNVVSDVEFSALPDHLKNPLVHIKSFIDNNFSANNRRQAFFRELIDEGCDIKAKLSDIHVFDQKYSYPEHTKTFFNLLCSLSYFNIDTIQEFIEVYRLKNSQPQDKLSKKS